MGELFASDVKAIAAPLTGTLNWFLGKISSQKYSQRRLAIFLLSAFVITKTFTNLKALLGDGETFWLFSGLSLLGTVFVFFVVPETKGKSLNEIQMMLAGEKTGEKESNETIEDKN